MYIEWAWQSGAYSCETFDVNEAINSDMGKVHYFIFIELGKAFNKSVCNGQMPFSEHEITEETLETAAKVLLYIITPQAQEQFWFEWYKKYQVWLSAKPEISLGRILSK